MVHELNTLWECYLAAPVLSLCCYIRAFVMPVACRTRGQRLLTAGDLMCLSESFQSLPCCIGAVLTC